MIRAEERFKCSDGYYCATTYLASGKYSGGYIVLNCARGNAQHCRCLSNADSEPVYFVHTPKLTLGRAPPAI